MAAFPQIIRDPKILAGKPLIKGTRISVEFVLRLLAAHRSEAEIFENHPEVKQEDLLACLANAHDGVEDARAAE